MFCHRTEKFLSENGVEPTVRNIAEDEEAYAELERMGTMTTPVTIIGGDEVVVGFNQAKLKRSLGLRQ